MACTLLQNALVVDGSCDRPQGPTDVLIVGSQIAEVSESGIAAADAQIIDLSRRTLMPGLIDAHVHVIATTPDLGVNATLPNALVAMRAARIMRAMLHRGFTTVCDLGGADVGRVMALEEGLIEGPVSSIVKRNTEDGWCIRPSRNGERGTVNLADWPNSWLPDSLRR